MCELYDGLHFECLQQRRLPATASQSLDHRGPDAKRCQQTTAMLLHIQLALFCQDLVQFSERRGIVVVVDEGLSATQCPRGSGLGR